MYHDHSWRKLIKHIEKLSEKDGLWYDIPYIDAIYPDTVYIGVTPCCGIISRYVGESNDETELYYRQEIANRMWVKIEHKRICPNCDKSFADWVEKNGGYDFVLAWDYSKREQNESAS